MKTNFIETILKTKFGKFIIRVYNEGFGNETVVLRTLNLDTKLPVILRVHSECLTGDLFKSLHCDCGDQLEKSLKIITKNGGILIYLRQEGRGIGLFEKMKTYQLQSKGYDTFEANVKLGHDPDLRTYDKVKMVLDDLNISEIKLLTNNPTKISEIANYGIKIAERIRLIIKPNKTNKFYLETKKNKFQHLLSLRERHYFYQFHVDNIEQINEISDFIKKEKKDPLLKICTGINANHKTFSNKNDIFNIQALHNTSLTNFLNPILHFSFKDVIDIKKELQTLKSIFPFVTRIQVNDLKKKDLIENIKYILKIFPEVDLPLDDENFDLIQKKYFRNLVKKANVFILLDNSKGRGIKEDESSLIKKINILLDYGINDIALLGGFGPNELDSYFKLKRYFKINFSIDAETKLKTNNQIDMEKTKLYLKQLINFTELKDDPAEQTKLFLIKHKRENWATAKIENIKFKIHPLVFHAGLFPSTAWCAKILPNLIKEDKNFCEVGCGSGVISCIAAMKNSDIHVVATDINPHAKENTLLNAKLLGLGNRIEVFNGDVLDAISKEKAFDSIFWNLPFIYTESSQKMSLEDLQVFDPGYQSIRKFFKSARDYLTIKGKIFIAFSSDLGKPTLLYNLAQEYKLNLIKTNEMLLRESKNVRFELFVGHYF